MAKTYLGDGVYIELDEFGSVVMTTSDGIRDTNTIVLEPEVLASFIEWLRIVKKETKATYPKSNALIDRLHPMEDPLGDSHHTDAPFIPEDEYIADKLAWFMGTLRPSFTDVESLWRWWHYEVTSVEEWKYVVRALRIHGLKIVDAPQRSGD